MGESVLEKNQWNINLRFLFNADVVHVEDQGIRWFLLFPRKLFRGRKLLHDWSSYPVPTILQSGTLTMKYLSLPPTRQDLTHDQKPESRLKLRLRGGEGRERAETRTLLVYAAHWPAKCNVGLMSQAVSRTQIWVRARMPGYSLH